MLNPAFSDKVVDAYKSLLDNYILPEDLVELILQKNSSFDTGSELRLQEAYTFEIFQKMQSLSLDKRDWKNAKVLDICCGTGFLSYHLLKKFSPRQLTLSDISVHELKQAEILLGSAYSHSSIDYRQNDILNSDFADESFDIIIGNSFLHHFYNLPQAIQEFKRLLKPGGVFVTLHEPTPSAVVYESGSLKLILKYFLKGNRLIDEIRYKGEGVLPCAGADVWIFQPEKIMNLFKQAGFRDIKLGSWNIFKPIIVAGASLTLNETHQSLTPLESLLFKNGIIVDKFLRTFIPQNFFGSFCLSALK